jgi:signal transduction histidine kinase
MTFLVAALFMYFMTNDLRKALTEATYELTEANIRLEEASEMKSQFTARTSHELRTPLSAIIVFTDLALRDAYGPLNERLRNGLEHVITSARHLKSIIDDILDLSKIEAGELEIEHEAFRLEEAVRTVEGVCEETVVDKNLEYSVWVSPEMPRYIFGDRHRITQIMLNLTSNAIKFTEQGEIKVRIEPVNRRAWTIVVSDTGPGIPEDQLERIFQAYRQLDHSKRGQSYKGTGLGLAIARNLAQLMGGSLVVGSDLGKGTTFTVTLPLEVAEELSSIPEPLP